MDNLAILPFICVDTLKKFLLNAVFARKNTLINSHWHFTLLPIQMKKRSVVPNAIKNLNQVAILKVTWSLIPRNHVTFVNFAVMAHTLKLEPTNIFWNVVIILFFHKLDFHFKHLYFLLHYIVIHIVGHQPLEPICKTCLGMDNVNVNRVHVNVMSICHLSCHKCHFFKIVTNDMTNWHFDMTNWQMSFF